MTAISLSNHTTKCCSTTPRKAGLQKQRLSCISITNMFALLTFAAVIREPNSAMTAHAFVTPFYAPSISRTIRTTTIYAGGAATPQRQDEEAIFKTRPSSSLPNRSDRTTMTAATTKPSKKTKKTKKTRKNNRKGKKYLIQEEGEDGNIANEDELAQHVSSVYLGTMSRKNSKYLKDLRAHRKAANDRKAVKGQVNGQGRPVLVLNADYQPMSHLPLSLWSWQEAVKAVFSGKCTVVDVYPEAAIKTVNFDVPLPSVIALNDYVPKSYKQRPAFTRRNVFLRDEYKCQYCNNIFHTRDLSLDHVHPRSMGGQLNWENAVTCCLKCNCRKGCTPVENLKHVGMELKRMPKAPTSYELAKIAGKMLPRKFHPTWEPYLGVSSSSSSGNSSSRKDKNNQMSVE